jgi:hypothetical protein
MSAGVLETTCPFARKAAAAGWARNCCSTSVVAPLRCDARGAAIAFSSDRPRSSLPSRICSWSHQ